MDKLQEQLSSINKRMQEALTWGDMELLKSDEMLGLQYSIEDELYEIKDQFEPIYSRQIEKLYSNFRLMAKPGKYVPAREVREHLEPLQKLVLELIALKGNQPIEPIPVPELTMQGSAINQAIKDAKLLLASDSGPISALDRVHTLLHGYLKAVCTGEGIEYGPDAGINQLLKLLKEKHSGLSVRNEYTDAILNSLANIFDKLNTLRNRASLAHANENLLQPEEAMLAINAVNSILYYLESKLTKK